MLHKCFQFRRVAEEKDRGWRRCLNFDLVTRECPFPEENPLHGDSKAALENFMDDLKVTYYRWYDWQIIKYRWIWRISQLVTVSFGFAPLIIKSCFDNYDSLKIILPAIASLTAALTLHFRIHDLYRLREKGRVDVQLLLMDGRRRYAAAGKDDNKYDEILADLVTRLDQVEREQGNRYFVLSARNDQQGSG
jgi:hypothetical protein